MAKIEQNIYVSIQIEMNLIDINTICQCYLQFLDMAHVRMNKSPTIKYQNSTCLIYLKTSVNLKRTNKLFLSYRQ